jgi:anti-anti-sigma regulatory factor
MTGPGATSEEAVDKAAPAVVTTIDLDRGTVVVRVRRFGWAEAAELRTQALRHTAHSGLQVRLDISGLTDDEASHLWLVAVVQANRMARHRGGSVVVVGAPPRMGRVLERLRVEQAPGGTLTR